MSDQCINERTKYVEKLRNYNTHRINSDIEYL